jgi:lipid A ethanolaminephosphotransferase
LKNAYSPFSIIFLSSLFIVFFDNFSFFRNVLEVYPFNGSNALFLLSLGIVLFLFICLLLVLVSFKYTLKPILIFFFVVASLLNYFMQTYHVVIDSEMIRNSLQTDLHETRDLLSFQLFTYLLLLGILPSWLVFKVKIEYPSFLKNLWFKLKAGLVLIALIVIILLSLSKFYTSFFREHKPLRYYTNPTYFIYSFGKYISKEFTVDPTYKQIGLDAKLMPSAKKKLVIMVVGEAAREDKFSLNGYKKMTNPLLKQEDLISLSNVYSCGTSTAYSVPCMFSVYNRGDYSYKKAMFTDNVLDILKHTKQVALLWRDNNSDSKGVALRIPHKDYKLAKNNPICDEECRDIGMLVGLDDFIKKNDGKDIFIVLHQMGNHGPAYYKRYTKDFDKFNPTCKTNQLEKCTKEEINNAYDNAILYTDYFLYKTITFLKSYKNKYETAMIYMSDHGESLGEKGIYLHGMPYLIAPKEQKHIGALVWVGDENLKKQVDYQGLKKARNQKFSQDYLFHSILGIMGVKTNVYNPKLDIFSKANH